MTSRINVDTIAASSAAQVIVDDALTVNETLSVVGALSAGSIAITGDLPVSDGGTGASTAADARSNLDVSQAINSMTAETAPAVDDLMPIRDVSAAADRKMRIDDMLKVVDSLTAHTSPLDSNKVLVYSGGAKSLRLDELLKVINDLPADTTPAITDMVATYDTSAGASKKVRLDDVLEVIGGLPVETSPATNDLFGIYDASEGAANALTIENMFHVVNSLTEDTTPDTDDFLLSYDVSASGVKKVKPENLPVAARKNVIINGAFDIWQRNPTSSYTSIGDGTYFADRWLYSKVGAVVHDVSRSTDVPTVAESGTLFAISALIDVTTADASIAAGDLSAIIQKIEGYDWRRLAQRACVLTFWVKATKTGTYCVALQNTGQDRSFVAEYTINTTETWEKKTIQFSASPSAGSWNYTNGIGARLYFTFAAGSTFQGTAGSWQSSNIIATANQVNGTDSTSNNFRITGVQLEAGSVATAFEERPIEVEVGLCERYYQKSYQLGVNPGSADNTGAIFDRSSGGNVTQTAVFRTRMRAVPTCTIYNPATGTSGEIRNNSASTNHAASPAAQGDTGFTTDVGITDGNQTAWQWTADAEL